MATKVLRVGAWENEQVLVTVEYDDTKMRMTAVHCVNNTGNAIQITVMRTRDGLIYETRFPPGDTRINIPTGVAGRIDFSVNERGQVNGYTVKTSYPYP
jgi:hypothetical protein